MCLSLSLSSTIPYLPIEEVKEALAARGIHVEKRSDGKLRQVSLNGGGGGDNGGCDDGGTSSVVEEEDGRDEIDMQTLSLHLRTRLRKAVWWENISLRRPWSWLSHSKYSFGMCSHECPINGNLLFFIIIIWISYVVSVIISV